jgi:hypothetical protein
MADNRRRCSRRRSLAIREMLEQSAQRYLSCKSTALRMSDPTRFPDQWIDARKEAETFARVVNQLGPLGLVLGISRVNSIPMAMALISIKLGA